MNRSIPTFFCLFLASIVQAQINGPGGEGQFPPVRVPNSSEQARIEHLLRDKYKDEFASRDPAARVDFSHKLRESADAEKDLPARFVMLRLARDMAIGGGDFQFAMDIIDDMAAVFPINAEEMKATALAAGVDMARISATEAANNYIAVADNALAIWNLDLAHKAAYLARKMATGNRPLMAEADKRDKLAHIRNHEVMDVMAAEKKLVKSPDDPQLNLIVGGHLCFHNQRWSTGLPYLAKSADPEKSLAQRDLADPKDPAEMDALADGWWDLSDAKANIPAGAARLRAAYWYFKALPGLTGERKAEAEKRMSEVKPVGPQAGK